MSNSVPLGRASQSTKLRIYPRTTNHFTAISSLQSGPEYSERLEPTQLDTNLIAEMVVQNTSFIDPVAALNAPIHQEMLFQAMSSHDATTIDDPIHREMILENVLLYEPAAPDTPIRQDYVGYSALRNPPRTQNNRMFETTSTAYGSGNKSSSLGDASASKTVSLQLDPEELRCRWLGCTHLRIFSCEATLLRHIKTVHIAPKSYKCSTCGYSNGRRDKVRDHFRQLHRNEVNEAVFD
ncbi:unnamed protein product [Penicillium pancosmium]